ncbi:LPS assembly lipoprotein LptE [Nitrosophilus alvini]|uniref:LPS assembly lipoprotein LptE n=1 Tax=Nitrosophilus alvini TaxID=2714855 RepID=UPI00190C46D8|nr:LPS assembly lipoprotein LptE [Nitrosophilus alvini]
MKKYFVILITNLLFLNIFTGCGYKPASVHAKKVLGDKIYTDVEIYLRDPENSVLIKDAVNEAIVSRFKGKLTEKEKADTILSVKLRGVSFSPLQYDKNGYVVYYRARVSLNIKYTNKEETKSFTVTGTYDFPIEPNAVISDSKRFEAIRESSKKALDQFISKITITGYLKNRNI